MFPWYSMFSFSDFSSLLRLSLLYAKLNTPQFSDVLTDLPLEFRFFHLHELLPVLVNYFLLSYSFP